MRPVRCKEVRNQIASERDIYVLLVSDECPFCKQVLDKIGDLDLAFDTLVVNADACGEELDEIINFPAVPIIVHFHDGKEVSRGVGVDDILAFNSGGEAKPVIGSSRKKSRLTGDDDREVDEHDEIVATELASAAA